MAAAVELPELWVEDDSEAGSGGEFISLELFPKPVVGVRSLSEGTLCWYRFLGRLFGKAMLDSKKECVRLVPVSVHADCLWFVGS